MVNGPSSFDSLVELDEQPMEPPFSARRPREGLARRVTTRTCRRLFGSRHSLLYGSAAPRCGVRVAPVSEISFETSSSVSTSPLRAGLLLSR